MVPHQTPRGQSAMGRLVVYEGVPPQYQTMKKKVIPQAMRVLRLKPHRKYCVLGDVSASVGWAYKELIEKMDTARKIKAEGWYTKTQEVSKIWDEAKAAVDADLDAQDKVVLANAGYL